MAKGKKIIYREKEYGEGVAIDDITNADIDKIVFG